MREVVTHNNNKKLYQRCSHQSDMRLLTVIDKSWRHHNSTRISKAENTMVCVYSSGSKT